MAGKMRMGMRQPGMTGLLKDGYKHMEGLEGAILKNVEACKKLSGITRTSLGPNGMNKLVINHLEKIFVTSDAATIVQELEVQHPAAKMLVMAAQMQENEVGDGANLVVTFAGELLSQTDELLRMGVHPSDVVTGYRAAAAKVMELLPSLSTVDLGEDDVRDPAKLAVPLRSVIAAKQLGLEGVVAPLVAQACVNVMPAKPRKPSINIDNVRVAKIVGGNVRDSQVVRGMVVLRDAEGTIKHVEGAKVAVFGVGLEASETETKGTVVLKSAEELKSYTDGEEARMEASIKAIADSGATVVVSGGSISEIALHYIEKFGLMALKIVSKFELRRLCRATGATALVKLEAPTEADLGRADVVSVQELSGRRVVVVRQDDEESAISTIVLRGATTSLLDDLERSVDGAVNAARNLCRDGRSLPGAGATETALALKLAEFAGTKTGLEQYAITKFADALEVVPRTLAENSGRSATETMSRLFAEHTAGKGAQGVLIDPESAEATVDTEEEAIHDGYAAKESALKLAADAAITVLRVDHIIMSKQAGGPKPRAPGPPDM